MYFNHIHYLSQVLQDSSSLPNFNLFLKKKKHNQIQQCSYFEPKKMKYNIPKMIKVNTNCNQIKTHNKICEFHYMVVNYLWTWGVYRSGWYAQCHSLKETGHPAVLRDSSVVNFSAVFIHSWKIIIVWAQLYVITKLQFIVLQG